MLGSDRCFIGYMQLISSIIVHQRKDFHSYFFMFSKTSLNKNRWKVHRFEKKKNLYQFWFYVVLKLGSHLPKKIFFASLVESPLKMMENAFYFILKALFILNVFQFLIWLFVHVEKYGLIRKIRLVSKFMASEPVW